MIYNLCVGEKKGGGGATTKRKKSFPAQTRAPTLTKPEKKKKRGQGSPWRAHTCEPRGGGVVNSYISLSGVKGSSSPHEKTIFTLHGGGGKGFHPSRKGGEKGGSPVKHFLIPYFSKEEKGRGYLRRGGLHYQVSYVPWKKKGEKPSPGKERELSECY